MIPEHSHLSSLWNKVAEEGRNDTVGISFSRKKMPRSLVVAGYESTRASLAYALKYPLRRLGQYREPFGIGTQRCRCLASAD